MKKINVLMIGPGRDVKGGMTTVVDQYYENGLDKKVNLKYIATVNDKNKFSKMIKMIFGYIEFCFNIKKYDIVHIHMASRMSSFRKGKYVRKAKENNKKVIVHIHGAEYKKFYDECNEKQRKYVRKTLELADSVIVLSEEWQDYFSDLVDKSKINVIYNAIIIPENFEKNLDNQKILFLGRLGERKGIYDLIDVLEKLKTDYPNIHLYAGGDGEVEKVKNLIFEKGLSNNFTYLGWIKGEEKKKYLKECSYYILPSYNEGMPMSLIEGMAYKNVAISTKVGGIPKVIQNGVNGIIIDPGDKENLYNSIKEVLENKELRIKYSENARKTCEEKFNLEKNINKLIDIYENLQI